MKRIVLIFILFAFENSFSQSEIIVTESIQNFLLGDKNSMLVNVPYGDAVVIEKQLKKEFKSWGGSFYVNRGEYTLVQGKNSVLGTGTINAYAKIKADVNGEINVVFTFDLGGVFLSSIEHAAQYKGMSKILIDFAMEASLKSLDHQESLQKEKLSYTKKNLKLLEKEKDKLTQDIHEYKNFIFSAEKSLELNIKNQGKTFESIQKFENTIDEIEKKKKSVKKN